MSTDFVGAEFTFLWLLGDGTYDLVLFSLQAPLLPLVISFILIDT